MTTAAANSCIIDSATKEARAETMRGCDAMGRPYLRGGMWWVKIKQWDGKWVAVSTGEHARDKDGLQRATEYRDVLQRRENDKRHAVKLGILSAQDIAVMDKGPTPITTALEEYLASIANSGWRKKNAYLLNRFVAAAELKTAGEMGKPDAVLKMERFLRESQEAGHSHNWIKKQRSMLRQFNRWLWLAGYCKENQAERVARFDGDPDPKVQHRAFEPAEFDALVADVPALFASIDSCAGDVPPRRRLFYMLRAWTGVRGEEAMRLVRSDFDLSDRPALSIRKEVAKNGMAFVLPLPRCVASMLADQIGMMHPSARVFDERSGIGAYDKKRQRQLEADLATIGIRDPMLNARSFRMTHETWFRSAGVDDNTIGTLRRDRGEGTKLLRRWHYTDYRQVMPHLRESITKAEAWYREQLTQANRARHA